MLRGRSPHRVAAVPLQQQGHLPPPVVEACVPDYETEVLSALAKLDEDYDIEIVEELLYQICIDVNPTMEIHQVSLPTPQENEATEDMMLPRGEGAQHKQALLRKVMNLQRNLKSQIVGQDEAISTLVRMVK